MGITRNCHGYVLIAGLFVGYLGLQYKMISWSTYYRIKYIALGIPPKPSLLAASIVVDSNPFFDQQHAVLVNMGMPSSAPRLQVVDFGLKQVVFKTQAMHGLKSGGVFATEFSNKLGSKKTALGRYVVVDQYSGKYGKAYRLAGLDATNSNALSRSIVLHQSEYVRVDRIGRSEGCPAVSPKALLAMKPYLHKGTLVWLYR